MVTYSHIKDAQERIRGAANITPVMTSRTLNQKVKGEVFIKCENLQRVGAFKFRGAYNAVSQLKDREKSRGVIAHSSGNHAQALALAAKIAGVKAVIVMPKWSPKVKVNATRDTYGAEVVLCENTIEARHATAQALIDKHGYTLIHPYDNDNIIAGAGTAALELLQEIKDIDTIIAPVGGGGLLSGTAIATKGFDSNIRVFAGEPKNVNDAYRSKEAGKILTNDSIVSIADGLLTNLCDRTFAIINEKVDRIITVSEQEILEAMRFYWERMKLVVEPSGAVSLAALLSGKVEPARGRTGIIISGGNIDLGSFFQLLEQKITPSS